MKHTITSTLIAATLITSGCATMPQGTATDKGAIARKGITTGAIGCAVGAIGAKFLGGNVAGACLAAGVTSGTVAAVAERNRQVAEANRIADEARRAGLKATVTVGQVQPVRGEQPSQQLKSMRIELPADTTATSVQQVLARTAAMSDASKVPVTITVFGSAKQRGVVIASLRKNLQANTRTTIAEADGAPALVLSPAPQI